ncbi:MAG: hypothetical protein K2N91_04180 [Muribaculaceae bacterium]|nr:hypothetical protein [Muribaculaceae bacterium]
MQNTQFWVFHLGIIRATFAADNYTVFTVITDNKFFFAIAASIIDRGRFYSILTKFFVILAIKSRLIVGFSILFHNFALIAQEVSSHTTHSQTYGTG